MAPEKRKNLLQAVEEVRWDIWLAATTIGLTLFGVVMVYSASAGKKNPNAFLFAQAKFAIIGLIAMAVVRRIDYHRYAQPLFVYGFVGICVLLLMVVFLFPPINNARRWITFPGFSAQPSELAKLSLVIFMAWFLSDRERDRELGNFWATVAPSCVVLGILAALIMKEPDFGTTLMMCVVFITMLFAAGVPMRHLLNLSPLLLIGGLVFVFKVGWRMQRLLVFLDPERDPNGKGYQVMQSLIAVGTGGIEGLGFGKSRQKMAFLPEANSDFIFAVVSEELGFYGTVAVVLTFGIFLWRGWRAGHRAPDTLGRLLAIGVTTGLIAQAFFNISVALSLVPTKGIPLPFVSAGGSSLIVTLMGIGILMNVSEQGVDSEKKETGKR
ncbi:MAG: putative lipid II flippase FtsW [Blastocatellia bacterium]|nr:putative lipid II flippase FtsW [Blastocatellia bacterium]